MITDLANTMLTNQYRDAVMATMTRLLKKCTITLHFENDLRIADFTNNPNYLPKPRNVKFKDNKHNNPDTNRNWRQDGSKWQKPANDASKSDPQSTRQKPVKDQEAQRKAAENRKARDKAHKTLKATLGDDFLKQMSWSARNALIKTQIEKDKRQNQDTKPFDRPPTPSVRKSHDEIKTTST